MHSAFGLLITIFSLVAGCCLPAVTECAYSVGCPLTEGYLQVSDKHHIFYATYGNPNGMPAVILHGGPGQGCCDEYTRFFDLNRWHVVMFDQRGAMRSIPIACMDENTPQYSIADIEALRKHLGIEKWMVFGNSWGSCLATLYGQAHCESCLGFILEGIFLGRDQDVTAFKDMGRISPDAYKELLAHIPEDEQDDILRACHRQIMDPDPEVHMRIARALMRWHLLSRETPPSPEVIDNILVDDCYVLSHLRAVVHYAFNKFFLQPNQVLSNMHKITHLPAILVHGDADTVCPPDEAGALHRKWQGSQLWMVEGAGHSCMEPAIAEALSEASDVMLGRLSI